LLRLNNHAWSRKPCNRDERQFCECHILVDYDAESGGVCLGYCPEGETVQVGLISVERSFPVQINVTDAQYVWRDLPDDITPYFGIDGAFFANALQDGEFCGISRAEIQFNRCCPRHLYRKSKAEA